MTKIKALIALLQNYYYSLPPIVRAWLHGLEVAICTAVVSSLVTIPSSDFTTKKGILEFLAAELGIIAACVRLYFKQSPFKEIITSVVQSETTSVGDVSKTTSVEFTSSK